MAVKFAVWRPMDPNGSLRSASSGQCVGVGDHSKAVHLLACDASTAKWELGNGGLVDVASAESILASSTLNNAHGAALTVDGLASTCSSCRARFVDDQHGDAHSSSRGSLGLGVLEAV